MRLPFGWGRRPDDPVMLRLPPRWNFEYLVYFQPVSSLPAVGELVTVIERWLDRHAPVPPRDELKGAVHGGAVTLQVETRVSLRGPNQDMLRASQPGEQEERRLHAATHGVTISATAVPGNGLVEFWCALAAARALGAHLCGVSFDPATLRLFPLEELEESLPPEGALTAASHLVVPASVGADGKGWLTTLGLVRFGLPELELRDVPQDLLGSHCVLMNAVAQLLLDAVMQAKEIAGATGPEVPVDPELTITCAVAARAMEVQPEEPPEGVQGWSRVRLQDVRGLLGGGFLRLVAPEGTRISQGEWLHSVFTDLWGAGNTASFVRARSEAMEIAHRRAMEELPQVKQRFLTGLPVGCVFCVKYGFPYGDGEHEYMWLTVNTWNGSSLQCQLMNTPRLRLDLRPGQQVELDEDELFDWGLYGPDDRVEGGYTDQAARREEEV